MINVFIDGKNGTTGLKIEERLSVKSDVKVITLPEEKRKDIKARKEALNSADVAILCLPDDAAKESVSLIENERVRVIDASTAHRTAAGWAYGFAELSEEFEENIKNGKRVAVPGCHAGGFIALMYPLVKNGIIGKDTALTCTSLTGYSGGGKKMIAEYESGEKTPLYVAPRVYGIAQAHKHLPEMTAISGLDGPPAFVPVVCDFYSGMEVVVPLFKSQMKKGDAAAIKAIYKELYCGNIVKYTEENEDGFLSAAKLAGKDSMEISVFGNGDRLLLTARYDNLGKGASGAAIECFNIMNGKNKEESLIL
ncbi:MAG: N-acetyl-gamma-glutamyl-phosphate reductase [Clostridia bacterium]|nr:N-acetyl-gamma-glutamyl-phosphate reductase [Clostridia bacterium]